MDTVPAHIKRIKRKKVSHEYHQDVDHQYAKATSAPVRATIVVGNHQELQAVRAKIVGISAYRAL